MEALRDEIRLLRSERHRLAPRHANGVRDPWRSSSLRGKLDNPSSLSTTALLFRLRGDEASFTDGFVVSGGQEGLSQSQRSLLVWSDIPL